MPNTQTNSYPDLITDSAFALGIAPENDAIWNTLFEHHYQFMAILTASGIVIKVNQIGLEFGGLQANEVIGRYFWDCFWFSHNPELQTVLQQSIAQASSGEKVSSLVKNVRAIDGSMHSVESTFRGIKTADNQIRFIMAEGHDVTEQLALINRISQQNQHLQQTLQQRDQLDFILNNTPALIGYWDKQLINQFSNQAYSRWFGKSPEQIKGRHLRELIGETNYLESLDSINKVLQGQPQILSRLITSETGENIHTELSLFPHEVNHIIQGYYVLGIDVTNQYLVNELRFQNLTILESMSEGIILSDVNRNIIYVNTAFEKLTGYSKTDILGKSCSFLQGDQTDLKQIFQMKSALRELIPYQGEIINYRKDGSQFWNELTINPIFDSQGQLKQFIGIQRDITERKHLEAKLISSEYRFRTVANAAPVLIWLSNTNKEFYWFNDTWLNFTGNTGSIAYNQAWHQAIHPEDLSRCLNLFNSHIDQHLPFRMEYRLRRYDGEYRWIDDSGVPRFTADHIYEGYIGSCIDITEVRNSKVANDFFNISHEIIYSTDLNGFILDVNQRFLDITGYSRQEIIGKHIRQLKSGLHDRHFYNKMWNAINDTDFWSGEITNRNKFGEFYSAVTSISKIRDSAGMPIRYLAIASDITAVIEKRRQLEHLAYYDNLTGLPNRLLLVDRMRQEMAHVRRHGGCLVILFIDLDGFKAINDNYGHEVGDAFLIAISQRMKQSTREIDTLVRLGGDEFILLLSQLNSIEHSEKPINNLLKLCNTPIQIKNLTIKVSASIGANLYCHNEKGHNFDIDTLIRRADQAMYVAKQQGKNRFHWFDDLTDSAINTRHETLHNIQNGLNLDEFLLYYQPKVNLRTGELLGVEALIRWQHPEQGILEPGHFMPALENHPISVELGEWVINYALVQLNTWYQQGITIPISINIDARHLHQHDFYERLKTAISAYPNFQHGSLEIEILETTAIYDRDHANRIIMACQSLGIEFTLDDFGAGYSSLTDLIQLPVKTIKIDCSYIRNMEKNPRDVTVVESLIGLVSKLGRSVIAEGVENNRQAEMLLDMGCELAQGYLIANPMPANDLLKWRRDWQINHPLNK